MLETVTTNVRGLDMTLVAYTRALKLCARMNRETEVLDFIDGIPPGAVLYDLGACEGRFALYAAMRGINVWAFEPESRNFQAMLENIELNRRRVDERLVPIHKAVGAHTGAAVIKIGQPWAGGHHKVVASAPGRSDLNVQFIDEQSIEVIALDEFVESGAAPPPGYLKIDVDGSELPVMHGASATLKTASVKSVMFELQMEDPACAGILAQLADSGFEVVAQFPVEPGLYNVRFERRG